LLSNCTPKCRLFNLSIALRDRLSYAHDPHVIRDPARVSRGIIRDANAREKSNFSTTRTYSARTRRDHRAASARERARVKLAKLSERLCWRNDAREGAFCRIYTKTLPAFDGVSYWRGKSVPPELSKSHYPVRHMLVVVFLACLPNPLCDNFRSSRHSLLTHCFTCKLLTFGSQSIWLAAQGDNNCSQARTKHSLEC